MNILKLPSKSQLKFQNLLRFLHLTEYPAERNTENSFGFKYLPMNRKKVIRCYCSRREAAGPICNLSAEFLFIISKGS